MSLTSLVTAPEGKEVTVVSIVGGRGAVQKLMAMGIVPGKKLKILGRRGCAMLIAINGSKYVIGRGLAMKVIVNAGEKS
uniref:Ferrous iron transport protein A n=1 Tax=Geoglobus ahangari TaxID=113653 RepID=A0A7C4S5E7_9EURY